MRKQISLLTKKRISFIDITLYEFTNWSDIIHRVSKWPAKLLRNNRRKAILNIHTLSDVKRKQPGLQSGLKQFMIKKSAIGQQPHRYFIHSTIDPKSEIIIDNNVFRKW